MIADFLVDYEYLASCIDALDNNDNGQQRGESREQCDKCLNALENKDDLQALKMLRNLVDHGNARLIVDSQKTCLEPMRKLREKLREEEKLTAKVSNETEKKTSILEWFIDGVHSAHRFRCVNNYGGEGFVDQIVPRPIAVLTKDGYPGASWGKERERFTLKKYFLEGRDKEKNRLQKGLKHSFGVGLKPTEKLRESIAGFCGDETEFLIIDRYAIGLGEEEKIQQCCINIVRWIDMISNKGTRACTFEIQVNDGYRFDRNKKNDENDPQKHQREVYNRLLKPLDDAWKNQMGQSHAECQTIKFNFVSGDGQNLKDDKFHDRYICSKTRVLSIGKGLDVFDVSGKLKCVTLHYSGRREGDDLILQLTTQMQKHPQPEIILPAT